MRHLFALRLPAVGGSGADGRSDRPHRQTTSSIAANCVELAVYVGAFQTALCDQIAPASNGAEAGNFPATSTTAFTNPLAHDREIIRLPYWIVSERFVHFRGNTSYPGWRSCRASRMDS